MSSRTVVCLDQQTPNPKRKSAFRADFSGTILSIRIRPLSSQNEKLVNNIWLLRGRILIESMDSEKLVFHSDLTEKLKSLVNLVVQSLHFWFVAQDHASLLSVRNRAGDSVAFLISDNPICDSPLLFTVCRSEIWYLGLIADKKWSGWYSSSLSRHVSVRERAMVTDNMDISRKRDSSKSDGAENSYM